MVLLALFYAEEDWRGKHAWEKCRAELAANGKVLDWNACIPPTVPDDLNFFKAPKMQEWFVEPEQYPNTNELTSRMTDSRTGSVVCETNSIVTEADAGSYLAWSDQFEPDFDLIREALKRPYARMDGDYSEPLVIATLNFSPVRAVAQMLTQRAHCYLLLGQPEKALDELTLLNDSRRMLEAAPKGQPTTLVAALANAVVTGLYANAIADGLQSHAWREPQLVTLQEQLMKIDLTPIFARSIECESASTCWVLRNLLRKYPNDPSFWWKIRHLKLSTYDWMPSGWVYRNMVTITKLDYKQLDGFDFENRTIFPGKMESARLEVKNVLKHSSPYNFLVIMIDAVPNSPKAAQTLAYNQTLANEAQIVCALERYHLAHGEYPETLDALVPQFITKLPHDMIGGPPSQGSGAASQPLHYHRTASGKFLLYSVGWNETDDGGQVVLQKDGSVDREKGDWVWR